MLFLPWFHGLRSLESCKSRAEQLGLLVSLSQDFDATAFNHGITAITGYHYPVVPVFRLSAVPGTLREPNN